MVDVTLTNLVDKFEEVSNASSTPNEDYEPSNAAVDNGKAGRGRFIPVVDPHIA
ncbi:hypothetical protein [Rhizobium binxianense]|uniref:hypothetical protein n=1 Tax=Rhizobium binxianense TaxID=3024242 RepID=UPI00234FB369|nr:hypothetical protein [Rhizobium sp. BC56]MDC7741764.1 hypothetical protein [Rhizobium sp. BC56]